MQQLLLKVKGFAGAIKRHGLHTGPKTHGSKYHRHAGSNGAASDPSKVFKGKKMAGQMGNKQVTVQNLEVVRVDVENNIILVKGSVPGPKKFFSSVKRISESLIELKEGGLTDGNSICFKYGWTGSRHIRT